MEHAARKQYTQAVNDSVDEAMRGKAKFGHFHNMLEGRGVLDEEVEELHEAIRSGNRVAQRKELMQVAAVSLRLLVEFDARFDPELLL